MPADAELAGLVADDRRVPEQPVRAHAAPERALGGELDRIGGDLGPVEAERLQVRPPRRPIGEAPGRVRGEGVDHRPREAVLVHVGQRGVVDDIVLMTGPEQLQEVPPALGPAGGEEGERICCVERRRGSG
jgi:hypothetical protein